MPAPHRPRRGARTATPSHDLFGGKKGGENVRDLGVTFNDGRVALQSEAASQAAKEKAVLLAGNVRGVEAVDDDGLRVAGQQAGGPAKAEAEVKAPNKIYPGQRNRVPQG